MNTIVDPFNDFTSNTVDNPAEFMMKTRFFVNGAVDIIAHRIKHRIPKHFKDMVTGVITSRVLTDDEKKADNIRRSASRAKQMVQFAVRQIQADHMLTIHTRDNIQDRSEFLKLFTRFIRLVRTKDYVRGELVTRKDKRDFPFVAVPELQDRGAYHMHLAVVGFQDVNLLRACWYVALGGSPSDKDDDVRGQIDVRSQHKMFGNASVVFKTQKLVDYLTKYISKGFEADDSLGLTRYTKSRGIPKVKQLKQFMLACFSNGQQDYVDAMQEAFSYADFLGLGNDLQLWGRGTDIFVIRGSL